MSTLEERDEINEHLDAIRAASITDIPAAGYHSDMCCPLCGTTLLEKLTYDQLEKVRGWTVAQLMSWHKLMKDSGFTMSEALDRTSDQPRPGIGAIFNPTVLGVNLHGMFVGIETDGYVHS